MGRIEVMFRSILPVVSTECDVLIVCRKHNDKEWKFKEQHAKMWENIAGAKRYSRPVVSTLRGERPRRPRRFDASVTVLGKLFTPVVPLFTKQRNW